MADRFETFEEFWPFYVKQHSKKATRIMHFVGTTGAIACAAGGLLTKRRWLLAAAPVCGYGFAWASHFFIEKNRPATFTYPAWSLRADFVMWWKMCAREMDAEVERVLAEDAKKATDAAESAAAAPVPAAPAVAVPGEAVN
jgi:hypothetical protein